eukprot:3991595-Amphidinium_carterae.1
MQRKAIALTRPCRGEAAQRGLQGQRKRIAQGMHPLTDKAHKSLRLTLTRDLVEAQLVEASTATLLHQVCL